jgi:hypothetical protein
MAMRSGMKTILPLTAALFSLTSLAAAQSSERSAPYAAKHVTCDRIVLRWMVQNQFATGPESIVVVEDRAGTTGVRFFVDRQHSVVTQVETWEEVGGIVNTTSLPGTPRIDYVNCVPASDPIGGITIEYFDAKDWTP